MWNFTDTSFFPCLAGYDRCNAVNLWTYIVGRPPGPIRLGLRVRFMLKFSSLEVWAFSSYACQSYIAHTTAYLIFKNISNKHWITYLHLLFELTRKWHTPSIGKFVCAILSLTGIFSYTWGASLCNELVSSTALNVTLLFDVDCLIFYDQIYVVVCRPRMDMHNWLNTQKLHTIQTLSAIFSIPLIAQE